jgi:hypothetical protein
MTSVSDLAGKLGLTRLFCLGKAIISNFRFALAKQPPQTFQVI